MTVLTRRTRWAAPLAAAVTASVLTFAPATAAPATPTTDPAASAAAGWLAQQMIANDYTMPGFSGKGTDWGLTIDAVFALASAGVAKDVADRAVDRLAASGTGFIDKGGIGTRAKLALALQVGGADPTELATPAGTVDLIADIRSSMEPSGLFTGANHFGQSLAVLALARTTDGVPPAAADYLLTLQCTTAGDPQVGAFGSKTGAGACGSVEGDGTGMVVSALAAAGYDAQDAAMQAAIRWMGAQQKSDGSFAANLKVTKGNSNSTGLVGQAARQLGTEASIAVADKARRYVSGLQVTCAGPFVEAATDPATGGGFIRSWRGAVAYDQAGYAAAVTGGIKSFQQDTWRRTITQGMLTLGDAPGFSELSLDDATPGVPALPTCEPPVVEPPATVLPAATFGIIATTRPVGRGASTAVTVSGLHAGEAYRITLSGTTVHTGAAGSNGSARVTIKIPTAFGTHKGRTLRVLGAEPDRVGERTLATAGPAKLRASVSKKKIKAKKTQKITVRGLLPRERLTVKITGKTAKKAYASASGTYTYSFNVTKKKGTKKVTVTGVSGKRKGSTSFKVTG